MTGPVLAIGLVVALAAVLGGCAWLARRVRRTGVGTGLFSPLDEIYHPSAWQQRQEIEASEERAVPNPSGDPPWPHP